MKGARSRGRRVLLRILATLVVVVALVGVVHLVVAYGTTIEPPHVVVPALATTTDGDLTRVGKSWCRERAGIREVYLEGTPEEIGAAHAHLLRDRMIDDERVLWSTFASAVPLTAARAFILDLSRVKYRHVDRGVPEPFLRELASEATIFPPDPFAGEIPTFQRLLFLHALYDIALGFEQSRLVGCTTFGLGPEATADRHAIVARAFDFEAADLFDRDKAVFFVRPTGRIPFASVAWPGLVGVVSGMNIEGITVVVHGGRAREPVADGMPVAYSLRDVLERAHDMHEALAILREQKVMVSHLVFVGDAAGHFAIVERAPGVPAFVRDQFDDPARVPLTNHFEGPLATDPSNERIMATTTTKPRRARLDELLAKVAPHAATVDDAIRILRDHECAGGETCPLGDRRAIDAFIATHAIVADATSRDLWVSSGPHLSGRFVRYELGRIFAPDHDPNADGRPLTSEEDPALRDGRYERGRLHASGDERGRK